MVRGVVDFEIGIVYGLPPPPPAQVSVTRRVVFAWNGIYNHYAVRLAAEDKKR